MAQQFIVEEKDGYILSALCKKAKLPLPTGYNEESYGEFVVNAGGIDNVSNAIKVALANSRITNVGIVVDANSNGVRKRTDGILTAIMDVYPGLQLNIDLRPTGWVDTIRPNLNLGIWIMPDNQSPGYLEHFLTEIIPTDDRNLALAKRYLKETIASGHASFSAVQQRKALLALFLAIQDEPGMNAQTAIAKGLLNYHHPLAQNFLVWFSRTFQLD